MSCWIRLWLSVVMGTPLLFAQAEPDNGAWKGRLYCLAAWAKNANPAQPKSLKEAYLDAPAWLPREIPSLAPRVFPIDSDSADARRWFGQGLSCLNLLWDEEAERAFRAVTHADPDCAMGYWGLAMVNVDQPGRASYFSRMASGKLRPETSPEVRSWVELLERFYDDPDGEIEPRVLRLASDLEDLAISMPDHVEAKALYLRQLILNAYRYGIEIRSPWAIDRIAEEVVSADPDHPSSFLRLFLWMSSKPDYLNEHGLLDLAITTEYRLGPQWRFFAEAQISAGQWGEGAESLVQSVRTGVSQRASWFDLPIQDPGLDENVHVLIETLSRIGRVEEALTLADAMVSQFSLAPAGELQTTEDFMETAYARGLRLYAQTCLEHRLHQRLQDFEKILPLRSSPKPWELSLRREIKELAEGGACDASSWLSPEARLAKAVGDRNVEEGAAIIKSLPVSRRRAFLPRALEILHHLNAGKTKEAMFGFDNAFRASAGSSDSAHCRAKAFVELAKIRGLDGEWMLPATSVARRLDESIPALVGAYRDDFPSAPDFELPDGRGGVNHLGDYQSGPVLVTFFLGAGCPKCVQQLHTFLPLRDGFREAGLPMVAISTDPEEVIRFTLPEGAEPNLFKILSDPELESFKSYFVINEFERRPLHGTFLLDADGEVLWWTTGNQPFMDPEGLLDEFNRVLSE